MRSAILTLAALLLAGCVTTAERGRLPVGATLLEAERGYCEGPIEIDSDPDIVVDEGETTTLELDGYHDETVEWRCLTSVPDDEDELDCPDATDYVRIIRERDEAFTVECYDT